MNIRNIAIVLLAVSVAVLALLLLTAAPAPGAEVAGPRSLDILEIGRAGGYGYAALSYSGDANITMLAYDSPPLKKVTIINDPDAVGNGNVSWFLDNLSGLKDYGFDVSITNNRVLGHGIFVVPAGAMPSYVLDDLLGNVTDGIVVFVGRPDIVLRDGGVKKEDWYSALDERQRGRVVLYGVTPDEFIENGSSNSSSLFLDVLDNAWAVRSRADTALSGNGTYTAVLSMNGSGYLRLIAEIGDKAGMVDSAGMSAPAVVITPTPESVFPWEKATLDFGLNKTNGTPTLTVLKDGQEVYSKELARVREENFFPERVQLTEPGNHVIRVTDNSGVIASGIIHVKDLQVAYEGSSGTSYLFNITVDGVPLDKGEAEVHLTNSTMEKTFYISGGELAVPAQLHQGANVFSISLLGTEKDVPVEYAQEGVADVYIKYGIPGIILVVAVYFGARMSRRPVYVIRVGEFAGEIRKEVRLRPQKALSLFKAIRKELGIGNTPLSAHEFAIALKRHVTEGADVTEGNVEEILQGLVKRGMLESHRQYYQLKGEGDVRRNSMVRRIRDKLIEAGVGFRTKGRRFVTEHLEIGFFGDKFSGNAAVVVEDPQELETIYSSLGQKELAALRVKLANGVVRFVTLDKLDDVL